MIKRVYYVEGLNHSLFSVGQFCDADLEVAFRKSTCFIRDLKGNDLLTGSRGTDLYSITLQSTNSPNPICLMAKATSSQAWLWHRRLKSTCFILDLKGNDLLTGSLGDKIICDIDRTPDLSQQSPQNCPKCGNPVDGHYCQGCALLRKKFKEDLFTSCVENGILQDSSEPSNDNTNVVNALRELFVVNQDPGKNPSQSPPQINHHCCYGCGDPLEDIFCHQCTYELCWNGAHYGYNCPLKVSIVPNPEPLNNQNIKELPPTVPSFDSTCYSEDGDSFIYDFTSNLVYDSPNVFDPPSQLPLYSCEFCRNDARYGHYCTPQEEEKKIEEEQAANALYWKIPACYNDDDDDYTITITHKEPDNSLMFTTFSNILFDPDHDFYSVDDLSFSDEDISKKIYSNPLFDEEIIFMKIDPHYYNAESDLIESLLNHDSSIISSALKIDSLFDKFAGELTLLKSIPPGINETYCDPEEETRFIKRLLYDKSSPRPLEEFISKNSNAAFESFSPFSILVEDSDSFMEEIDLSFTPDYPMPSGIEEDDYDSEWDILILEELLGNDSFSLPKNESFHFDIPSSSRPPAKPPDDNSVILNVKMMGDISEHKVPMPRLMFTQPNIVLNQEKSPDLLPHLGHEAFQLSAECPMMIYGKNTHILDAPCFHLYPP
nr:integrase, catalytic region, zinc finger, CCHC-type, peptidase aspartic, catalytic [Tanacetum cinerariifolium]